MLDEITYHSQTSTAAPLKFGVDELFHPTLYNGCDYLSMLRWKLIHVSKRGPVVWYSAGMHLYTVIVAKTWRNITLLNTLRLELDGRHFADEPFLGRKFCVLMDISLNVVPRSNFSAKEHWSR